MNNKIIIFDLDGVLCNFHFLFSTIANELFGTPVIEDINDVKKYRWQDYTEITSKQVSKVWDEVDKSSTFWKYLTPLVNNKTFVKISRLSQTNTIYFVSARKHKKTNGDSVIYQTKYWLNRYMPTLMGHSIILTHKKGVVLDAIDANFFIDDNVENIIEVSNNAPNCKSFLLVRPYNSYAIEFFKNSHRYKNVGIVYSVEEFLAIIEKGE